MSESRKAALIRELGLLPHPEGGHFREIFRSEHVVRPADGRAERSALTTIFFLLAAGQHSRWHRVRSDEVWHFYEGDPLELLVAPPDLASIDRIRLGNAAAAAAPHPGSGRGGDATTEPVASPSVVPVHTVPAGFWQAARPTGEYSLVGCTVAPGFDFDDFSFLDRDPVAMASLIHLDPDLAGLA